MLKSHPITTVGGSIALYEGSDSGSNKTTIRGAAAQAEDILYILPAGPPTSNQVLTHSSGNQLAWMDQSAGDVYLTLEQTLRNKTFGNTTTFTTAIVPDGAAIVV